jgi:hypothetical protein
MNPAQTLFKSCERRIGCCQNIHCQNIQLRSGDNALCYNMDWQQIAALAVVAATAGVFLRAKLRRRAFSFARDTHCGCSSPSGAGAKGSIVFSARKGQRAKIIVKAN